MTDNAEELIKKVKPSKIILPIIIGLAVVGFMLYKDFDYKAFSSIIFNWNTVFWIFMALLMMVIRDVGYMVRLMVLTDGEFNLRTAFRVVMLWEFTSAVTPSAIGGTSIAILFVTKENINIGRSSAIVLATSVLDEMYFILVFPIVILLVSSSALFTIGEIDSNVLTFANEFFYFAVIGYGLKFLYTLLVIYGLFFNPHGLKALLISVFKIPFFKRWQHKAVQIGDELIESSNELKSKKFIFWLKAFLATFFSWTARYWVVNMLLLALFGVVFFDIQDHFLIFARQLVMWLMMLVSPKPGGSGFAEFVFTRYLGEFFPIAGMVVAMALVWRIVTYYPYLIAGALIIPKWLRTKFKKPVLHKKTEN